MEYIYDKITLFSNLNEEDKQQLKIVLQRYNRLQKYKDNSR